MRRMSHLCETKTAEVGHSHRARSVSVSHSPKGIEEQTKTWDKTIIDRRKDLMNWVELFREFVARNLKVFAYENNHSGTRAGHGEIV